MCVSFCVCVSFRHSYSDNFFSLADVSPASFLSCLSASVCPDPITFGHVELNASSDWVIIFLA